MRQIRLTTEQPFDIDRASNSHSVNRWPQKLPGNRAVPFLEPQITGRGVHVWPFDPLFPLDVRFLLLNRKQDIRMHRPDHLELIYIESGDVVYQYEERQLLLGKGDIVLVGNNAFHRCRKATIRAHKGVRSSPSCRK